ncbi:MAG: xanthine dehydrogenase family protein subunit M [Chloroflexota bacterium]|nr:MAG: xanthine dehydrogenase family protein subunit M [Chloroflexota bacterium]
MRDFEYLAPATIDEALAALAGGNARPFAGATDVLVQMRVGRIAPDRLVDVKKIPELNRLSFDATRGLSIGAAVPCYLIYADPTVVKNYPGLVDSASIIGGIGIQGRATLGGNLCNAAPSGDSIPTLIALSAVAVVRGPKRERRVPVEAFCIAPGRTVLEAGEILVSIDIPTPRPNSGAHYQRFIPRYEMDIAVVGVGASVELSADKRTIVAARVALASVAPTPLFVPEAGVALVGTTGDDAALDHAAQAAQAVARPITDMRGSAAQRRHLVGVLTRRVLRGAIARARGETVNASH